jgi:sialidase-1
MNPLLSMSLDEGPSWPVNKVLEPGKSAYCDLTALPKGPILHSYESGSDDGNKLCRRLTMARFNLEWLSDGTERTGEGGR